MSDDLTAAGVAPQEPSKCQHNMASYTDSETMKPEHFCTLCGYEPAPLDPEKVAEVIEQMRDRARKERDVTKESLGQFIARALCEAYTEGKLT